MAVFSDAEKIDVLIKSSFGVTSTDETLPWYNEVAEPFNQYTIGENILIDTIPSNPVFDTSRNPSDIGLSSSDFHSSNNDNNLDTCSIVDDSTGTVRRFRYLLLDTTTGTNNAGRSWTKKNTSGNNVLHNSLAFNYKQDGSYAPYESKLYRTNGSSPIQIGPSTGSWSYNTGTGILFFADYEEQSHVSTSNPPAFLVYVYIGQRGLSNFAGGGGGGSASSADGNFTVSGDIIGNEDLELNAGIIIQDDYIFDTSATRLFPDARFENLEVRNGLTVYGDISTNNFNVVKNVTFSGDITSDTLNTANIIQFDQTGTTLNVDLSGDVYRNSITTFGNIDAGGNLSVSGDASLNGRVDICGNFYAQYPANSIPFSSVIGLSSGVNPDIDLSLNAVLSVGSDVSFNSGLYVSGTTIISGNVGIGTVSPNNTFHIYATDNTSNLRINNADSTTGFILEQSINKYTYIRNTESTGGLIFHAGNGERMRIMSDGKVGIGPVGFASPKFQLDVNGSLLAYHASYGNAGVQLAGRLYHDTGTTDFNPYTGYTTARFAETVIARSFFAYSDSRIKTNIQEVNDSSALDKLRLLKPSLYNYIDVLARGDNQVYGFIAQEVKEVLPDAVSQYADYIPNIFSLGTYNASTNILTIENENYDSASLSMDASNNVYKNVRLYDASDNIIEICIEEIVGPKELRIKEDPNTTISSSVFIYGQEVEDFHKLNKDAIFTIATSALQELDRQLQAEKAKVATLESQLTDVLTRLAALESA